MYKQAMAAAYPILYIAEADPAEAILSSGLLKRLHDEMPKASFTVVGSPESAPLFRDVPRLERLLVLPRETKAEWLKLWGQVKDRRWFLVVDLRGSKISSTLQREKRAVKKPTVQGAESEHAVIRAARALGLEDDPPAPHLFVSEETQNLVDELIGEAGDPIMAVGPGVQWIGRQWPFERFTKVATHLLGGDGPMCGGRLMIVGGEAERDAAYTIRFAVARERVIELQGKLDLLQTCAALRRARLFLGADSVWTQLAVAAGVPSVGVYGPSDEAVVGPWLGRAVRGPRGLADYRRIDPGLNQAINHMMDVPMEPVLDAALDLHARTEPVMEPPHG
ncbi:glycosyltransferase family 9 protein [Brevundimonas sp. 2R-24]|uniref:Glycosyltransferase family 9 protein n=1 Tax=Peiella sedimenti TaxID=3061083 RepID=A0ABT8SMR8_9CAUL|nr:glycosyltransferase family 9 protein [Caulobacteraceae bacterium XZ-24]